MAEEASHAPRYVKLTRDLDAAPAAAAEDIRPGELNQPVPVPPQVAGRKCGGCGQVLPESYQAPADEPWTTGIFGCAEDPESCRTGLFCPCVLFGRNIEALREDIPWTTPCTCHAVFVEGGIALAILTAIFHGIDPSSLFLIGEGLVFSWLICATSTGNCRQELQRKYHLKEHRERKGRLADNIVVPTTIVNPPPVQEMSMVENHPTYTPATGAARTVVVTEHDDGEVIP